MEQQPTSQTQPADPFDLEQHFAHYLKLNELHRDRMPEDVYSAYRRSYFAGVSDLLMTLVHDISNMSDNEGAAAIDKMMHQVESFWMGEGSDCPEELKEKAAAVVKFALQ